jgi:hypothetical protein
MSLVTLLANVPKWLLDKRALNQPKLPLTECFVSYYSVSGNVGLQDFSWPDAWGRIGYYTSYYNGRPYTARVLQTVNEAPGAEKLIWETTGPGVVSALMVGVVPYYKTDPYSQTYASSNYEYDAYVRAELDGVDVSSSPIAAQGTSHAYKQSGSVGYYLVLPAGAYMIGGLYAPRSVPLFYKDSLKVYAQVTRRTVSSSLNTINVYTDAGPVNT